MTWVRLNVGGEMVETSLATVTKYQDSHLAKMFLSVQENGVNEEMETVEDSPSSVKELGKEEMYNIVYNIDCDPQSFKLILSWLRYSDFITSGCMKDLSKRFFQVWSCSTNFSGL